MNEFQLQWGRVRLNAETTPIVLDISGVVRLQWGRVRLNAETKRQNKNEPAASKLQWGRVRLNAETRCDVDVVVAAEPASMGPRSVERGNRNMFAGEWIDLVGFNGAAFG